MNGIVHLHSNKPNYEAFDELVNFGHLILGRQKTLLADQAQLTVNLLKLLGVVSRNLKSNAK
jgi:hypothetical protein